MTKPNPENCNRTPHLSVLMTVHSFSTCNTTQNSSDNVPSYLQTKIIAQMLSIRGRGRVRVKVRISVRVIFFTFKYSYSGWGVFARKNVLHSSVYECAKYINLMLGLGLG